MRKTLCLMLCLVTSAFAQKWDGLAPTPPMGWNTWNTFQGNISEKLVKETADTLVASGMRDAGYKYVVLDDCWMLHERDAKGNLVADPEKFPSGMKALGDYLHSKGLKFGIYGCAGAKTCGGYPGGRGHEFQDALSYASWGVDYLKYDWCDHGTADGRETYKIMRDALRAAGRPVVFSLCEWGQNKPWEWASDVGHLWRTTGDIGNCYDCKAQWSSGWKTILDQQAANELEKYAGPDHWNDPDMLEVGNDGLTVAESRAHFSFWCLLAAPLMAGNDIRHMNEEIRSILTNAEAIAVNQDKLGKQGYRLFSDPHQEVWVKPLSDGEWAMCIMNAASTAADVTVDWARWWALPKNSKVRDLWKHTDIGTNTGKTVVHLESHDVLFVRLTPSK